MIDAGASFFGFADALGNGHHRVWVNGLGFDVQSRHVTGTSEDVLDALERRCDAHDGGLGERLRDLGSSDGSGLAFRIGESGAGMLACVDLGSRPLDAAMLGERVERLIEEGDFAALGGVRLARVRETSATRVHVVTVASRGAMRLAQAFPEMGDAPGSDPRGVPRPPHARRLLSAFAEGRAGSVTLYEGGSERDLEAWLRAAREAGFSLRKTPGAENARVWVAQRRTTLATLTWEDGVASVALLSE